MERVINCVDCNRQITTTSPSTLRCNACRRTHEKQAARERARRAGIRVPLTERVIRCETCKQTFIGNPQRKKCDECRRAHKREVELARYYREGRAHEIVCIDCGEEFRAKSDRRQRCDVCQMKRHSSHRGAKEYAEADKALERLAREKRHATNRATYRAATLAEAERVRDYYDAPGRAEARENALTGFAPASVFHGIRKGV